MGEIYWGCIGIMENKMETTKVYWCYVRIMENKMKIIIEGSGFPQIKGNCPYPHSSQNKGRV